MLTYLFVICDDAREPGIYDRVPAADRVYTAPGEECRALAAGLYPGVRACPMEEFSRSATSALAAFDALTGNFRVLFQADDRILTVAFVLPAETVTAILEERMLGGADAALEAIRTGIVTARGQGGYLIAQ